jgi:hypothetical protein
MVKLKSIIAAFLLCAITLLIISCQSDTGNSIQIDVNKTTVGMGKSIKVEAILQSGISQGKMVMLPYVNGKRWGSHEFVDQNGKARFILPLPNPGPAIIQVIAVPADNDNWMGLKDFKLLRTGSYMPTHKLSSNTVLVNVAPRTFAKKNNEGTLFGMQWEPWFTPGHTWAASHAVPLMGLYESTNPDVTRQHILWFMELGVDFIIPDWSNHIWNCKHWSERREGTNSILHCTQLFLEVLADMRDEGLPVPKVALMPGLSNGPPATMQALNEELDWIYQNYIRNPRFKELWMIYDGKPLIIILDTGVVGNKKGKTESTFRIPFFQITMAWSEQEIDHFRQQQESVDDTHFTVRWISSQNQTTRHHELGYWSWMDGSLNPIVTYKDRIPEAITITPALFAEYGWTAPEAYGRKNGWTYLESFKTALEYRPLVVMLHQFNEFTGQKEGHGYGSDNNIYLDSYSVEFSDDLEPVSLTAPGYRGDNGGWGYFYLNMTRALMDIYRGNADDVTLMAVNLSEKTDNELVLEWNTIGVVPDSYTIKINDDILVKDIFNLKYTLSLENYTPGKHTISVIANGVGTRYKLSPTELDVPSKELKPVVVTSSFIIE